MLCALFSRTCDVTLSVLQTCNIAEGLLLDYYYPVDGTSGFLEMLFGVLMNQTGCCWRVSEKMRFVILDVLLNLLLFANSALINYRGV